MSVGLELRNGGEQIDEYGVEVWACELSDPVCEVFVDAQLDQGEIGSGEGAAEPFDKMCTGAVLNCVIAELRPRGCQLPEGGYPAAAKSLDRKGIPALL